MDQNSQKGSLKGYHSLPFAVKVSRRRSFEQFRSLNKRRGRFPHHSIPPCKLNMPFVLFLSNMHYWPSARWSIWLDIWPNSSFCILLDFLKVLYFFFPLFFSWLVMPRDLVVRLFAARTHALKLASLLRTYERWICSKSSILFNETK